MSRPEVCCLEGRCRGSRFYTELGKKEGRGYFKSPSRSAKKGWLSKAMGRVKLVRVKSKGLDCWYKTILVSEELWRVKKSDCKSED